MHHRLPTSSTAYKGNRRVLPSCFFPNVEGIMAKLLTDWSFQEMDPYLWESTNVTKLILPWSVDKVFPYQIICMIWNIYVSRYMCIGYCHQIQCDVIMLGDNLLMITTGMEIIPLNILIWCLKLGKYRAVSLVMAPCWNLLKQPCIHHSLWLFGSNLKYLIIQFAYTEILRFQSKLVLRL